MSQPIEVLLREHVENLGLCGDVVKVAPGYARNYLMPRRLAIPATAENQREIARRATRLRAEEEARLGEITAVIETLSQLAVSTIQKCDVDGHLYGSVNAAVVAELCGAAGTSIEEKAVRLDSGPLKTVGEHKVRVHVHGSHFAEITVTIEPETKLEPKREPKPQVVEASEDEDDDEGNDYGEASAE